MSDSAIAQAKETSLHARVFHPVTLSPSKGETTLSASKGSSEILSSIVGSDFSFVNKIFNEDSQMLLIVDLATAGLQRFDFTRNKPDQFTFGSFLQRYTHLVLP